MPFVLHSFQGLNHIPALGYIIDGFHPHHLDLGPVFVVDLFFSDATLEEPLRKCGLDKEPVVQFLVRLVVLMHFVCCSSQQLLGLLVKDAHPSVGGTVTNGSRKDPLAVAVGVGSVAAVAMVLPVGSLVDLAPVPAGFILVGTGRVPGPTLLVPFQKSEMGLEGQKISLVTVFAELLALDVGDSLALVERIHAASHSTTGGEGLDGRGPTALGFPPRANIFRLGAFWFHKGISAAQ
mmetsp:Transcript_12224/g.25758  ORF Transcript_12224/g.25758 Transcript_12224/m.25758 type:complete len:236 (-) Transcript_12224:299-1006(-)